MVTVNDIFQLTIETDMKHLAHSIYWAILEGKVTLNDCSTVLNHLVYDEKKIASFIQQNTLEIGKITLYVLETFEPNVFAFYLAENPFDAVTLFGEQFRSRPKNTSHAPHLLSKLFYFEHFDRYSALDSHRSIVVHFPYYLGHAIGGKHILTNLLHGSWDGEHCG